MHTRYVGFKVGTEYLSIIHMNFMLQRELGILIPFKRNAYDDTLNNMVTKK
jgi:hypothetical protein